MFRHTIKRIRFVLHLVFTRIHFASSLDLICVPPHNSKNKICFASSFHLSLAIQLKDWNLHHISQNIILNFVKFWYLDLHFRSFNVGLECPSSRCFSSFISNNKLKWEKSKIVHFFYCLSSPLPVFPRASYGYIFTPPFSNYTPVYCHQCNDADIFLNCNCFSSFFFAVGAVVVSRVWHS